MVSTYDDNTNPYYLSLKKTESLGGYDYINAFIIQKGQIKQLKTGRLVNLQDRADKDFKFSLPLFLNKNDSTTVYFCVHQVHKPFIQLEPQLVPKNILKNEYQELADKFTLINFTLAGGVYTYCFIIILNTIFYLFDRNAVYLYYSGFIFFMLIRLAAGYIDFGHPYWVTPLGHYMAHYELIYAISHLNLWSYLKSATILLDIKKRHPKVYTLTRYFTHFIILQILISFVLYAVANETVIFQWAIFSRMATLSMGLISILLVLLKIKTINARIISIGNIFFTATAFTNPDFLSFFLQVKSQITLLQYSVTIGTIGLFGEILCISIVIALNSKRIYNDNLRLIFEQQKEQSDKHEMRRQLASDLHDDIGSSLSSIALLSERIKATLNGAAPEAQVLLNKISSNVRLSIENTQTTIWAIDTRYDKLSNLIEMMKEFSGSLSDIQTFEWSIPPKTVKETIELTPDLKKHLYLIFKESINNAVKYAQSKVVSIEITCQKDNLTMRIQDFGKGFERQAQSRSLGLYSIENRANILRGVATIQSECGKGTMICVKVPLNK